MNTSSAAVIDSGLVVFSVIDTPQSELASRLLKELQASRIDLFAPRLWIYEVTSVIHGYLFEGLLAPQEAERALETAIDMSINLVEEDIALYRSAFHWASRLNHRATYDSFYLALAERLGLIFWTADRRLANNAQQNGVAWVHWMGEIDR